MFKSLKSQLLASSLAAIALIILAVVFIFIGHLGWAALILGISCLIIIVLNIWFSRCVCDPIAEHTVFAKRIAEGSYGIQMEDKFDNELGSLTAEINNMSRQVAIAETSRTDFISQVSHELRTPLTAITGWAETIAFDEAVQGDSLRGINIISKEAERLTLRPYAVKESAKRWYMIAYCIERQGLRVYGLDRVQSLEITDRSYKMPRGFDVDELFATSFGIYLPEQRAQKIVFRASGKEAKYLRDLPLHSSQCEEESGQDHVTFSIFVCAKDKNGKFYNDLIMEFCRYGSRIEVLSPEDVREAVASELKKAASMY